MELDRRIASIISPNVLNSQAYVVQDASGMIKLDAMENPYSFPEELTEPWLRAIRLCDLNRYPDPKAKALCAALRRAHQIPEDTAILLGNGSDELIQILCMAVALPASSVLAPEPTFTMYAQIAKCLGLGFVGVPLNSESFTLNRERMLAAIEANRPSIVFLSYPNNPTGNLFDAADIEAILDVAPGIVVIDEAYAPFAGATFLPRLCDYQNLLLLRTLSKLGLAGLRLGYAAGNPAWIEQFDKIRLPYNINMLTQVTAGIALSNPAFHEAQSARIRAERERLFYSLNELDGVRPFPSRTNFVLFRLENCDATDVFLELNEAGVLVKNLNTAHAMLSGCLRVTVGTATENESFIRELTRIILQ